MQLGDIPILDAWHAAGGGPLRGNRGRAFWRDGDGYNVALNLTKNTWYDFRDNVGGGVLRLVEVALHCDKRDALSFLEAYCGLDPRRPLTQRERCSREVAPALAQRLADFARGVEIVTKQQLAVVGALQSLNIEVTGKLADWHRYDYLLKTATPEDLAELWEHMPEAQASIERLGREDREHAEAVTAALVETLARTQAQEKEAA